MSHHGETFTNPVTGELAVIRHGTEDGPGPLIVDLYVEPGGRVVGAHRHANISEQFMVLSGTLGIMVDGRRSQAGPGTVAVATPGVAHDWWNAGEEPAHVLLEINGPAADIARFEAVIVLLFGLAHDGKVDGSGMPGPLQLAVLAREYRDVICFLRPPRLVQRLVLPPLAALGRALGRRDSYPHHAALVRS